MFTARSGIPEIQLFYIAWTTGQGLYQLLTMFDACRTLTYLHPHVSFHCATDAVQLIVFYVYKRMDIVLVRRLSWWLLDIPPLSRRCFKLDYIGVFGKGPQSLQVVMIARGVSHESQKKY